MDDLVPTWLDQLLVSDPAQQEGALRKLIYHSTREATVTRIKKSGKIKNITASLKSENEYVSMLAAWVTALVTFKDEETRHLFARANVIEGLVELLENTDNPNVVQKACWAITNLSSDDEIRDMIAQTNIMKLLTHLYRSTSSIDVKKAAVEPLINLLADKELQRLFSRGGGISATISLFPHIEDVGEQKNATIMLYFLSIHFDELRAEIVRQGALPVLQKQLLLNDNSLRELTMRLLNNLSVCELNEMPILGSGVLFPVFDLLNSDEASEDLKKQSLMLLSNLATNVQVRASIRYCAWLDPVLHLLANSRLDLNEQALRFVINITFDEYCRKQLLDAGAVELINGKRPQWSSGTEQINKLSLMAMENLLTPISDAVQAYLKTEVEIEFTPIDEQDDDVIDVLSDEEPKAATSGATGADPAARDKSLVIGVKPEAQDEQKPVVDEPSMDLDLVLEQLKVLADHRKRVKENKEQAQKEIIQHQQQVKARREEEEQIKQKITREKQLRTEGTQHARREVVAKDLLKTESEFLKTLEDLLKHYILPLREAASTGRPIISEGEVRSIFSITDMIYNINKSFLEDVKNRLKAWSYESVIGDAFTKWRSYYKAYQQYVNNYSEAVATYSKCSKNNKEFQKFVKQAELKTDEQDLFALLIQPIQRVPKYLEYLREFEKFTPPHHPDVRQVKKEVDAMEVIVEYVNQVRSTAEKANKIVELENKFSNLEETLLTPTRLLIKESTLIQEKKSGSRYIYLFLFSDVLLISTQRNKKQHKIRQIIHLTKIDNVMELSAPVMLVANDEISTEVTTVNSSERATIEDSTGLFRFAVVYDDNGKKRAVAVAAPTVADRSAWVAAITTESRACKSKAAQDKTSVGSTPKFTADMSDM